MSLGLYRLIRWVDKHISAAHISLRIQYILTNAYFVSFCINLREFSAALNFYWLLLYKQSLTLTSIDGCNLETLIFIFNVVLWLDHIIMQGKFGRNLI